MPLGLTGFCGSHEQHDHDASGDGEHHDVDAHEPPPAVLDSNNSSNVETIKKCKNNETEVYCGSGERLSIFASFLPSLLLAFFLIFYLY